MNRIATTRPDQQHALNLPLGRPALAVTLPGLVPPADQHTAQARRAWLLSRSGDDLRAMLLPWLDALAAVDPTELAALAQWLRVPLAEVVASPFGLRACLLGANAGAMVVQHELRTLLYWSDDLIGDQATLDADHGSWQRGSLHAGRYQSFQLDGAFATLHPDHSSRWTPHELLHRAVGYGWRAGMPRWETYLCARLAELLPVVHWYGPDLVARLDEDDFSRDSDIQLAHATMERARWLTGNTAERAARIDATMDHLRRGIVRFEAEFSACKREAAQGEPLAVDDPLLDSKADATAYVAGHHDRLRSPRVVALLSAGGPQPQASGASALAETVETVFDQLLFGPLHLDPSIVCARSHGRLLWDVAHRAVHCTRWDPTPLLPELTRAWAAAESGDAQPAVAALATLMAALPVAVRADVACVGLRSASLGEDQGVDLIQLSEGIDSAAPATVAWLRDEARLDGVVTALALDKSRAPLIVRLGAAVADDVTAAGLLAFETALLGATQRDDVAERLSEPFDHLPTNGHLLSSAAFSPLSLAFDAVELAQSLTTGSAAPSANTPTSWLIGETGFGVAVIPCPPQLLAWWHTLPLPAADATLALDAALRRHTPSSDAAAEDRMGALPWLIELADAGAISWLPAAQ